jgi:acyl-CoA reductase-like NAD-dependent aldehyde dehydrogenase
MEKDSLELPLSSLFDGIYSMKDDIPNFGMLIGGKWRGAEGGLQFDVHTPIDGSVIARAQMASLMDVDSAITTAQKNRGIRDLPGIERIEIFNCAAGLLELHKDEFARVLQLEAGKSMRDATAKLRPPSTGSG